MTPEGMTALRAKLRSVVQSRGELTPITSQKLRGRWQEYLPWLRDILRDLEDYHAAFPVQDGEVPPEEVKAMVQRKNMLYTILPDKGFTATYVAIDTDCLKVSMLDYGHLFAPFHNCSVFQGCGMLLRRSVTTSRHARSLTSKMSISAPSTSRCSTTLYMSRAAWAQQNSTGVQQERSSAHIL